MGIEEKIKDIEDEIQKTPYNKATSHHIGKLKAKLSKLKEESIQRSSSGTKGQGLSGKKVEVKFFPKDTIKTISFETAGTLDFDVDIKIGVTNNTVVNVDGAAYSEPLSFKVPSSQAAEAKEVVRLVKEHYLF